MKLRRFGRAHVVVLLNLAAIVGLFVMNVGKDYDYIHEYDNRTRVRRQHVEAEVSC